MGNELVDSSFLTSTEIFKQKFPYYLAIGMSYEQYWNDDSELPKYYRQAHELKMKQQNQILWLQGFYFYEALCSVSPILNAFAAKGTKAHPYRKDVVPLTEAEAEEVRVREEAHKFEEMRQKAVRWAENMNTYFDKS